MVPLATDHFTAPSCAMIEAGCCVKRKYFPLANGACVQ